MVRTAGSRSQSNQPFSCQKRSALFAEAAFRNLRRLSRACCDPISRADRAQPAIHGQAHAVIKKDDVFGTHTRSWCAIAGLARCASIEICGEPAQPGQGDLHCGFWILSAFPQSLRKAEAGRRPAPRSRCDRQRTCMSRHNLLDDRQA